MKLESNFAEITSTKKEICCCHVQSKEKGYAGILAINGRIGKRGNRYGKRGLRIILQRAIQKIHF